MGGWLTDSFMGVKPLEENVRPLLSFSKQLRQRDVSARS